MRARLARPFLLALLAFGLLAACGRSPLDYDIVDQGVGVDGSVPCGDGRCASNENCTTCPLDCGLCAGCGDAKCAPGETCASCPEDCSVCPTCGDGFCKDGETCLSCAPDCGKCPSCGDKTCDPRTETCFSCPDDCGACPGCGDGACRSPETCASCQHDCGVCAVCGNAKCEGPFETCSNCHQDCGDCQLVGCIGMLTCAFQCIDNSTRPPGVHVSCVGDCVSRGCPSARFFFDQAFNCFIQHLNECGASFNCLSGKCQSEVAACLGSRC